MKLHYINEHTSCVNYLPNSLKDGFKIVNSSDQNVIRRECTVNTNIIFVTEGSAMISYGDYSERLFISGDILTIPSGVSLEVRPNRDSEFVICPIDIRAQMCERFSIDTLSHHLPYVKYDFTPIRMNERISSFLALLKNCLSDGLNCIHFNTWKKQELLLLFRAYYTKEELTLLFYPLLNKDTDFKSFVLSTYHSVTSVAEFAQKYNCSISTFNRRFKLFFGENAFTWINRHRVESIKEDLENTKTPFATLAHRYGFSSQAYFSAFCKKQFSLTPKQIRKKQ